MCKDPLDLPTPVVLDSSRHDDESQRDAEILMLPREMMLKNAALKTVFYAFTVAKKEL